MTYRIRNIGIAVALAIVAALLTTFYVTNYKRTVQQGEQTGPRLRRRGRHRSRNSGRRRRQRQAAPRGARDATERRPGSDLQAGPDRRARRRRAHLRRRADLDAPLPHSGGAGHSCPAEGQPARPAGARHQFAAHGRNAPGRRPGRHRRQLAHAGRGTDPRHPRCPSRTSWSSRRRARRPSGARSGPTRTSPSSRWSR